MSSPPPPKATLHARHISTLPYENLSLRHAKEVDISLDVRRILGKFMANGRGGCCMEHSIFFNNVFRALGFQVHLTGARARQGDYKGWVHVANIVTLPDGTKWVSDTGFGGDGDGMRQPMPLVKHHITQNIGPQEIRFEHAGLVNATNTAPDEKRAWIYQYRSGADQPWNSFFCFTETEFLHQDHWTSKHADCFQTWTPMAVELLRREGADGVAEIYGKLMLANGDVKENLGGKTGLVRSCKSEAERLEALRDVFGMSFTEEQQAGITGRRSELLPNWRNDGAERGVVDIVLRIR
ncbi:putative tpa: arylamine n-acetyltransferase 2 protein [Neofusicoccum parvum UCRNP2]|uniref:Putative tpa: arylamine n-acetyltransferase 2 protein n=1 Tax=Botryosphaeria parva (strain UCR-NP2) TaxID=1287680 RepID=R1FZA4_BOTPV|nr:putative tpa: arylamine n-acetyltransferase 2 protein [Neofusicoccum parvum UCRNP2]